VEILEKKGTTFRRVPFQSPLFYVTFWSKGYLFFAAFFLAGLFLALGLAFSEALAFFSWASKPFILFFAAATSLLSFVNFFFACPILY
jgi:hypothetical protein